MGWRYNNRCSESFLRPGEKILIPRRFYIERAIVREDPLENFYGDSIWIIVSIGIYDDLVMNEQNGERKRVYRNI